MTQQQEPTPWRSRVSEIGNVLGQAVRTLRLVAEVDARLLYSVVATQVVDALTNVGVAYVGKRIIDAIVTATRQVGHPWRPAVAWVGVELALLATRALLGQLNAYNQVALRSELGLHVNLVILDKAANVSYPHFEDPAFMNSLTQARREASSRPLDLVNQSLTLLRQIITLIGYGALLWSLGPWAVGLLVITAVPPFWAEARHGREVYALQRARSLRNRQSFYLESVLTSDQTIKEVKLFGIARWLIDRYGDVHRGFHHEEVTLAKRRGKAAFALGMVSMLAFYGTYGVIVARTVAGAITLGAMTLYLTVFRQGQGALQSALSALAKMYEDNLFMATLFEFLETPDDEPDEPLSSSAVTATDAPRVQFQHVSFRYPGAETDALTDVNISLQAGETIALVGRNGAGKTTLIKLLVGLYRPTSGRILVDGVDITTLSAGALRRQIGVIFQDFVRFQFSAADNVGVGWLPAREDELAIQRAVADAGANEVVARLPKGLNTALGRAFGGDDLSVGQWQRIALARAFMRKSKILVLDEPTASLDAEAEHEIFQRFGDLKAGRTALLITHRFSTVRMADRIVVFEGGRVIEQGSHNELLAADGQYARMFKLQASGYEIEPEVASA